MSEPQWHVEYRHPTLCRSNHPVMFSKKDVPKNSEKLREKRKYYRVSANNFFWLYYYFCSPRLFFCYGDILLLRKNWHRVKKSYVLFFRIHQPKKPTPPPQPKRKGTARYKPNPKFAEVNLKKYNTLEMSLSRI